MRTSDSPFMRKSHETRHPPHEERYQASYEALDERVLEADHRIYRLSQENLRIMDALTVPRGAITAGIRTIGRPATRRSEELTRTKHTPPRTRAASETQAAQSSPQPTTASPRVSGDPPATDSFSTGSDRGITLNQLAHAEEFGGLRTRSRAEVEIQRRKLDPINIGRARAASAPGALEEGGSDCSEWNYRRPSFPVEIVIHNQAAPLPPPTSTSQAATTNLAPGVDIRLQEDPIRPGFWVARTRDWADSAWLRLAGSVGRGIIALVTTSLAGLATFFAARNGGGIQSNGQAIQQIAGSITPNATNGTYG